MGSRAQGLRFFVLHSFSETVAMLCELTMGHDNDGYGAKIAFRAECWFLG